MSHEVLVRNEEVRVSTPRTTPAPAALQQVVETVQRDSQQKAETFLTETVVPHGGE